MSLTHIVRLARPGHWVKNAIVLLPVIFAARMHEVAAWLWAGAAAAAFCLASSAVYIINDIRDRSADRQHPRTKDRPLAAGDVSPRAAAIEAGALLCAAVAAALYIGPLVLATVAAYLLVQLAYTYYLKRKMIVDVICIALGFVFRAVGGAAAIRVPVSPWLIICTFTICLFMGFCKRCNEVVTVGDAAEASRHRPTLAGYTTELLTHLITLSAGVAVMSYLLYTVNARTVEHIGTDYQLYTLPIVIYAVFRFAMLSMRGSYADPTSLILRDRPFQLTAAVWVLATVIIVRWGTHLQQWLQEHM
jgi:4-hydroxybenzoate polyprenyltransferase